MKLLDLDVSFVQGNARAIPAKDVRLNSTVSKLDYLSWPPYRPMILSANRARMHPCRPTNVARACLTRFRRIPISISLLLNGRTMLSAVCKSRSLSFDWERGAGKIFDPICALTLIWTAASWAAAGASMIRLQTPAFRQIAPRRSRSQDPENAIENATVVHSRNATRLVGRHRLEGGPIRNRRFIAHDSTPLFEGLNHRRPAKHNEPSSNPAPLFLVASATIPAESVENDRELAIFISAVLRQSRLKHTVATVLGPKARTRPAVGFRNARYSRSSPHKSFALAFGPS
ncbi:hypothetical protein ABIE91_001737 [Bradyrhizobium elkanii]